jgi:hypothetical protein
MGKKQEQEVLPGVPGPAKRKVIDAIEDLCLERDKLAGKRTALSDKIAEMGEAIQAKLVEHKLEVYTYEDANEVLQDVFAEPKLKRVKSKLNPKKSKKGDEE